MLFAELEPVGGMIFLVIIMVVGLRQTSKMLKGNDAVRGAAKKGMMNLLGRIFKN
jgi:hypothetical protein